MGKQLATWSLQVIALALAATAVASWMVSYSMLGEAYEAGTLDMGSLFGPVRFLLENQDWLIWVAGIGAGLASAAGSYLAPTAQASSLLAADAALSAPPGLEAVGNSGPAPADAGSERTVDCPYCRVPYARTTAWSVSERCLSCGFTFSADVGTVIDLSVEERFDPEAEKMRVYIYTVTLRSPRRTWDLQFPIGADDATGPVEVSDLVVAYGRLHRTGPRLAALRNLTRERWTTLDMPWSTTKIWSVSLVGAGVFGGLLAWLLIAAFDLSLAWSIGVSVAATGGFAWHLGTEFIADQGGTAPRASSVLDSNGGVTTPTGTARTELVMRRQDLEIALRNASGRRAPAAATAGRLRRVRERMVELGVDTYAHRVGVLDRAIALHEECLDADDRLVEAYRKAISMIDIELDLLSVEPDLGDGHALAEKLDELASIEQRSQRLRDIVAAERDVDQLVP